MTTTNDLSTLLATAVDERITKTLSLHESQTALAQVLTPQVESIAASALLNALLAMAEIPAKALGLTVAATPSTSGGTIVQPARQGRPRKNVEGADDNPKRSLRRASVPAIERVRVSDAGIDLESFVAALPKRRASSPRNAVESVGTEYQKRVRARRRIDALQAALPVNTPATYRREIEVYASMCQNGTPSADLFKYEDKIRGLVIEAYKASRHGVALAATEQVVATLESTPIETVEIVETVEAAQDDDDLDDGYLEDATDDALDLADHEDAEDDADEDDADEDEDESPEEEDDSDEEPLQAQGRTAKGVKVIARPKVIATRTRSGMPIVVATRETIEPAEVAPKRRLLEVDPDFV